MSKASERIIKSAQETTGGADSLFVDGHEYVPKAELDALRAENERLREVVNNVADCLEECMIAEYSEQKLAYPHNQQKYENDMEPIKAARAALTKGEG